jgi:hypothetical protein
MTTDPNNPEILIRVPNEVEAAAVVAWLASEGIRALTSGAYTAGFRAEAPGDVRVLVKHEDLERAKQLLANRHDSPEGIDWSQVDVGEPEEL